MRRSVRYGAVAIALSSCLSADALSQTSGGPDEGPALRVCADPGGLPFSNDKGEGFENRIATLFADKLHLPLHYTWYPNSVGFLRNTLRARRCDLVMGIASGADMVMSTNPYYRSSYAIVTRRAGGPDADAINDPRLRALKIGVIAGTPPADLMAASGLMANARPYHLHVDTRAESPGKQMIEDLAGGQIDAALLWGPIAGYFARRHGEMMRIVPLVKDAKSSRMVFYISMGVRPGETGWKNTVNQFIQDNTAAITAILKDYGVPLLDARDNPLQ